VLLRDVLKARWSVRVFSHGTSSADEVLIGRPSIGRQVSVDTCRFLFQDEPIRLSGPARSQRPVRRWGLPERPIGRWPRPM